MFAASLSMTAVAQQVYEKGKPWKLQKLVGEEYVAHQELLEQ